MKKKLVSASLILCLLLSLAACGGGQGGGGKGDTVEIDVWTWDVCYAYFSDIKADFEAAHPDIKVNLEEMGTSQIYNKLTTGLQTGSGLPDVFTMEGEQMAKFGNKFPGKLADLSDMVNPDDFMPVKISEVSVGGSILGVPWDSAPAALFYRKDFFEQAGVNPDSIKTWDDYVAAGKTIHEKLGIKMMPLSASRNDIFFRMLLNEGNGFYFDEAGNSTINSDAAVKAMETVKKIYDADLTLDYGSWDEYIISMKEGTVATVPEAVWIVGSFKEEAPETKGKWGVMKFPVIDETSTGVGTNGGSVVCIPAGSKKQEAAKEFVKFAMMNVDNQIKGFESFGLFPSYKPVFASDKFNPNDDFFNGEDVYTLFAELGGQIPAMNYSSNFEEAVELSRNAMARVLLSGGDPKQTLDDLQKEFMTKFGK